ncbi:MAG: hypothetical protein LBB21_05075 [Holosporaceae bacterium]|jgi:hypothetical protein|nr:hypothetical protein [Holosporaceae bacterium]
MKKLLFLLCFLYFETGAGSVVAGGVMAMSAASSLKTLKGDDFGLKELFAPKGGVAMKEVMLVIEENMNNNGAVKLHIIIVYDEEVDGELKKMSAYQYFRRVDQLIKDHPDKLKIFEWELVAKERIIPWVKVEYPNNHMLPIVAYVFAKYSGSGEYRAKIPPSYKKVKITLKKENFHIDYEDKENKNS